MALLSKYFCVYISGNLKKLGHFYSINVWSRWLEVKKRIHLHFEIYRRLLSKNDWMRIVVSLVSIWYEDLRLNAATVF